MNTEIQGKVYFIDRANIDTDQIIPAKYLTGVSIDGLGPHLLEDLDVPGFDPQDPRFKEATILVTRENFGCGSSREHAVWALEANSFQVVIASSFARIFRQNMFNRGLLAIELLEHQIDWLFAAQMENCSIDLDKMKLRFWFSDGKGAEKKEIRDFQLTDFDKTLVLQGGLVGFAVENY